MKDCTRFLAKGLRCLTIVLGKGSCVDPFSDTVITLFSEKQFSLTERSMMPSGFSLNDLLRGAYRSKLIQGLATTVKHITSISADDVAKTAVMCLLSPCADLTARPSPLRLLAALKTR